MFFISFLLYPDIDQIRRQDLFFAEQKMKRRSDQYEKILSTVLINMKKLWCFLQNMQRCFNQY
jgi:hypothetical protein